MVVIERDGVALHLGETAIKPIDPTADAFGLEVAYFKQWGQIVAPDELSVGAHTLQLHWFDGVALSHGPLITFVIDPAGSPVCS